MMWLKYCNKVQSRQIISLVGTLNPRCLDSYSYSHERELHASPIMPVDNLTMLLECIQHLHVFVSTLSKNHIILSILDAYSEK